jgi:hypothetical protein
MSFDRPCQPCHVPAAFMPPANSALVPLPGSPGLAGVVVPLRLQRRRIMGAFGAAVASVLVRPRRALAATSGEPVPILDSESVYFEETGHTVSGAFWRFWRSYGLDAFGYPITEAYDDAGVTNQYFQRARFELIPEGNVRLGFLGIEAGAAEPPPAGVDASSSATSHGMRLVPETGHVVQGAFLGAYDRWKAVLGPPIAPEHPTTTGWVQYFARARLEWDPVNGVRLGLLGTESAAQRGVDTAPAAPLPGAVRWSDVVAALVADLEARRALGAQVSGGLDFVPEYGERWIAVSLARQRVTAYEHTTVVLTDLCSTGAAAKGLTSKGIFAIWRRVENETMDSTTIGIPKGDPRYYRLENVLYTQYFDHTGEALHYAWWHSNFGQPK